MGFLGLSFGSSKSKSESNFNKTENTTQSQTGSTQQTQTSNTNTNQNTSSQGTSTSNQSGTSTQTGSKTSTGTGSTSLFGDNVLKGLEDAVSKLLPGFAGSAGAPSFDSASFVNQTVQAANSAMQTELDKTRGGLGDMIGAGVDNSSMGTLLMARAQQDAAANLAGIRANATKTAADITNTQTGQGMDFLQGLLGALKGGTQTTTQSGTEGTTGTTNTSNTGTTNTSETGSSSTQSATTEMLSQLVQAFINGTVKTSGTESTKSSGRQIGANLSLGK